MRSREQNEFPLKLHNYDASGFILDSFPSQW